MMNQKLGIHKIQSTVWNHMAAGTAAFFLCQTPVLGEQETRNAWSDLSKPQKGQTLPTRDEYER